MEGQRSSLYTNQAQSAVSDAESSVSLGLTTVSPEETPTGDEPPAGFRIDTEPPSLEPEVQAEPSQHHQAKPGALQPAESKDSGDQVKPKDNYNSVMHQLNSVTDGLRTRGPAVPEQTKVNQKDLLLFIENPYGDSHTMLVQAPISKLNEDEEEPRGSLEVPSAPPQALVDQAFQTKPVEDQKDVDAANQERAAKQLAKDRHNPLEARSRQTYQAQKHRDHKNPQWNTKSDGKQLTCMQQGKTQKKVTKLRSKESEQPNMEHNMSKNLGELRKKGHT